MASFLSNLWESVFQAGPTPTLLLATNLTFGALQLLLFGLLLATYSIHFVVLSVLCGGLWYSINWFAVEVAAAQAKEERKKRDQDDEGEETEVEGGMKDSTASLSSGEERAKMPPPSVAASGKTTGSQAKSGARLRRQEDGDKSASEISTDSEWEKVEDTR